MFNLGKIPNFSSSPNARHLDKIKVQTIQAELIIFLFYKNLFSTFYIGLYTDLHPCLFLPDMMSDFLSKDYPFLIRIRICIPSRTHVRHVNIHVGQIDNSWTLYEPVLLHYVFFSNLEHL